MRGRGIFENCLGSGGVAKAKGEEIGGWRVWVAPFPRFEHESVAVTRGRELLFWVLRDEVDTSLVLVESENSVASLGVMKWRMNRYMQI